MKKQILNFGFGLTKAEQKMILGGDPPNPPEPPGGGGSSGGGSSENCANLPTCTHDGDCYNLINNAPSFCQSGCCITAF